MKYDLNKLFRTIKSRERNAPEGSKLKEFASIAVKRGRMFRDNPNKQNLIAFTFAELAWSKLSSSNRMICDEFEDALLTGNYIVSNTHIKTLGKNYDPEQGIIYVAVSNERPNLVKLGATTVDLKKRLQAFKSKYSYSHFEAIHSVSVNYPARIEKVVADGLKKYRVTGCIAGDSIEWYKVSVSHAKRVITLAIKSQSIASSN